MAKTDIETHSTKMAQAPLTPARRAGRQTPILHRIAHLCFAVCVAAGITSGARAQVMPMDRLHGAGLEVYSPDLRVSGPPGQMQIAQTSCAQRPGDDNARRRIVDIAVQEWAFFGFPVVDQTGPPSPLRRRGSFVRRPWMDPAESERVAASIAGYWSVTPDGGWILERQNAFWNGPRGVGERWRDPWSAAFISWTLCEAGYGDSTSFRRSINHRTYIDQAIRARDSNNAATAYVAWDVGEQEIEPGDLLCSARRHGYRSLQDRRRHLGEGARTHCDIVVHIDNDLDRILAIGGNVRGRVSLKLLYATSDAGDPRLHREVGRGNRAIFAHLKLEAEGSEGVGLLHSPSIREVIVDPSRRTALEGILQIRLPDPDDS